MEGWSRCVGTHYQPCFPGSFAWRLTDRPSWTQSRRCRGCAGSVWKRKRKLVIYLVTFSFAGNFQIRNIFSWYNIICSDPGDDHCSAFAASRSGFSFFKLYNWSAANSQLSPSYSSPQTTWFLTFYTSLGNTINKTMTYFSSAAFCSRWPRMAFLIMVFLPMRTTAWPRRDMRIVCICLLPTLSTPTRKHLGYSSSNCWKTVKHLETMKHFRYQLNSWNIRNLRVDPVLVNLAAVQGLLVFTTNVSTVVGGNALLQFNITLNSTSFAKAKEFLSTCLQRQCFRFTQHKIILVSNLCSSFQHSS